MGVYDGGFASRLIANLLSGL